MASYTVSSPNIAAHAKTLVASTADTVTFDYHVATAEIVSLDGAAAIYITVDGSTPTVGGAATYVMPAAVGARTIRVKATGGATVVKLISSGTPVYSVQASNAVTA